MGLSVKKQLQQQTKKKKKKYIYIYIKEKEKEPQLTVFHRTHSDKAFTYSIHKKNFKYKTIGKIKNPKSLKSSSRQIGNPSVTESIKFKISPKTSRGKKDNTKRHHHRHHKRQPGEEQFPI